MGQPEESVTLSAPLHPELDQIDMSESDLPEILYHCTDTAGFLGILQSRTVWLTHSTGMNDHGENSHVF